LDRNGRAFSADTAGHFRRNTQEGLMALQNPMYVQLWSQYAASGLLMILGLSALPIVSSVKPWMKHDKAHSARIAKTSDAQ
jgi:hypothetical protein